MQLWQILAILGILAYGSVACLIFSGHGPYVQWRQPRPKDASGSYRKPLHL